jgi:hypothetical protein
MSFKLSTFLFDYTSCREDLLYTSNAIDQGNTEEVYKRVRAIRKRIGRPKRWILHNKGTYFDSYHYALKEEKDRNCMFGHWLLVILSTYLKPLTSLDYNWPYLANVLHTLEWENDEIWELLYGHPIETLIYPDFRAIKKDIEVTDPCWRWISPERSMNANWLPTERILSLRESILRTRQKFLELYPSSSINFGHKTLTSAEIDSLFMIVLKNCDQAESQNSGWYSVRYQEY